MGLDVVDQHLQLGQLDFNNAGVTEDGLEIVEGAVRSLDPNEELVESVLELPEAQKCVLQLALSLDHPPQKILPAAVDFVQRFLQSGSLVGRGAFRKFAGLPAIINRSIESELLNCAVLDNIETRSSSRRINETQAAAG